MITQALNRPGIQFTECPKKPHIQKKEFESRKIHICLQRYNRFIDFIDFFDTGQVAIAKTGTRSTKRDFVPVFAVQKREGASLHNYKFVTLFGDTPFVVIIYAYG